MNLVVLTSLKTKYRKVQPPVVRLWLCTLCLVVRFMSGQSMCHLLHQQCLRISDMAIDEELFQTFGFPVSDTQFQIIQRYNDNRMLEEMFDPERIMWLTSTIAGMQSTSAANGAANMTTNQSQSAIDFH